VVWQQRIRRNGHKQKEVLRCLHRSPQDEQMEDIGSTSRGMFLLNGKYIVPRYIYPASMYTREAEKAEKIHENYGPVRPAEKGGGTSLSWFPACPVGGWVSPAGSRLSDHGDVGDHGDYGDSGSCTSPISDQGAGSDPLPSNLKDEGFVCKHLHSPLSIPGFQAVTPHYLMTRRANGWFLRIQESAAVDALQTSCGPAR